jgi:hypothetical protein
MSQRPASGACRHRQSLPGQPAILSTERKERDLNDDILNALDEEIARLRQARAVLAGSKLPARKKATALAVAHDRPRRNLSAKARKAIADAQHKRWAKVKSEKKAAAARK